MASNWTDEKVAKLKAMWMKGEPASVISTALGFSRSAVLGKVHRLGMSHPSQQGKSRKKKPHGIPGIKSKKIVSGRRVSKTSKSKPLPERAEEELTPLLLPLEALSNHQCRWPYGEVPNTRFCAHRTAEGSSYCPTHHNKSLSAWQPEMRKI